MNAGDDDNLDPLAFTGADGKIYTPSQMDGDYSVQEIPPRPPSSKQRRKARAKRSKSAGAKASAAAAEADPDLGRPQNSETDGEKGNEDFMEDSESVGEGLDFSRDESREEDTAVTRYVQALLLCACA